MAEAPKIKLDTDKELSPETRAMLGETPEDDGLTDGQASAQPSSSLRIPVPSAAVPATKDD